MIVLASWSLTLAQGPVPRAPKTKRVHGSDRILPRYFTPEERLIPQRQFSREDALRAVSPSGTITCPPEYAPADGVLINWKWFEPLFTEVIVGLTATDPNAIAYLVVDSPAVQASATSTLTAAGADMDYVEFIIYQTNSNWIRDYGPQFIFQDLTRAIVDPYYGSGRPLDDAFPGVLGEEWTEPVYDIPVLYAGGNFLTTTSGDAFMSDILFGHNPGLTEAELRDLFREFQGVELIVYDHLPATIDGTGHIDMWMYLVSDTDVIVSEFSHANPSYPGITVTEGAIPDLLARGYTVHRIPAHNSGAGGYNGVHFTYTNATIVNDKIFIPRYGGTHAANDAIALAVYQAAMPGHTVIPVDCATAIPYAGAIHCLSMQVSSYVYAEPAVKLFSPDGGEFLRVGGQAEIAWAADDDVGITGVDLYYSTDGGLSFPHVIATGELHDGSLPWTVPDTPSEQCRVKVVVRDADLNVAEDVSADDFTIGAAVLAYSFPLDDDPGWTTEGLWAWGRPTGGSGDHGAPDPTTGYTGDNVYGYNLTGGYEANMPERRLTSPPLDCTDLTDVTLTFWRWLGVEEPDYDHAYVRVSTNGSAWTTLWENAATVDDGAWVSQEFDLSAIADGQPTVYLRWTMGTADNIYQWCGWNIDDIEIWAAGDPSIPGDVDDDGDVDMDDCGALASCLAGPEVTTPPPGCPAEEFEHADLDSDADVDMIDYTLFENILKAP